MGTLATCTHTGTHTGTPGYTHAPIRWSTLSTCTSDPRVASDGSLRRAHFLRHPFPDLRSRACNSRCNSVLYWIRAQYGNMESQTRSGYLQILRPGPAARCQITQCFTYSSLKFVKNCQKVSKLLIIQQCRCS